MIYPGLVSITFRDRSPENIIRMAEQAGLYALEWGGDVHVPHGDTDTAVRVRQATQAANLACCSYGSYYRAGVSEDEGLSFASVLETAETLEAPLIRIWAGRKGSEEVDEQSRQRITADCRRVGDMAAERNIRVALEFHGGTLTDTPESAARLLSETDGHNVETLWQPGAGEETGVSVASLRTILPKLANMHVFHWRPDKSRLPLREGKDKWAELFDVVANEAPSRTRYALMEFVKDGNPEQFYEDAECLKSLLEKET